MSSTEQTWRGLLTVMEHSQASKQIYSGNKCNMASSQKNLKKILSAFVQLLVFKCGINRVITRGNNSPGGAVPILPLYIPVTS